MPVLIEGALTSLTVGVVVGLLVAGTLLPFRVLSTRPLAPGARNLVHPSVVCGYVAAVAAATLVPFPAPSSMTCPDPGARPQWVPLHVLTRLEDTPTTGPGIDAALTHLLLNGALLLPLGVLLARWWQWPLRRVGWVALLVSVGIELTQLTGVWFVYDCAYRVFDVDDLLANTVGALGGAVVGARWGPGPREPQNGAVPD